MTPIRGFFKRLLGSEDTPDSSNGPQSRDSSRSRSGAGRDGGINGAAPADQPPTRRRRGRRGGRGRGAGARDTQPTAERESGVRATSERRPSERPASERPSADRQARSSARPGDRRSGAAAKREQGGSRGEGTKAYTWGKRVEDDEARRRIDEASRRRRGVRGRTNLDAPLPEDIAFRSRNEGGDGSILPGRRKRPPGLRDTERVIIGGPRTLGGWSHGPLEPPEPAHDGVEVEVEIRRADEAVAEPVTATPDAADEADEAEGRPRRRRGKRGGRGRRPRTGSDEDGNPSEPSDDAAIEDDEDGDEGEEDEPVRARPPLPPVPASLDLPEAFAELGVTERSLVALARYRFVDPTPIQAQAIPALMAGHDVVGVAQTGSGKTVAFGIPMMERLDRQLPEVQGLVLVPTRELAQQVLDVLRDLGEPWGLDAVGILGGHSLRGDFKALEARPHVVVGTPGRVIDHLKRGTLSLRHVSYAVLDEADQMLDIGFLPDIRRILSRTPQRRQTSLFSATMPTSIKRLIWQFMNDPQTVKVDPELATVESIEQIYFEVAERDKVRGLRELIERELKGRTLVFCRMKRGVDRLARMLADEGVRVGTLHGDMDQRRRDRVVQDFRAGALDILIATNVAARGLDVPEITHVVNYDVPQNAEEYVHRTGRTGRTGRDGKAITFVGEWDVELFDVLRTEFGDDLQRQELHLYARPS